MSPQKANTDTASLEKLRYHLEVSETKFRRLFEMTQNGVLIIDPVTENIINVNPFLLDLLGYSAEDILGKKLWEIDIFKNAEKAKEVFAELHAKEFAHYEALPLRRKDGQEICVDFVSTLYRVNRAEMMQCNIRDITDQKRSESLAAVYLQGVEEANQLLVNQQKNILDIGNISSLPEEERVRKIIEAYAESLADMKNLLAKWKQQDAK